MSGPLFAVSAAYIWTARPRLHTVRGFRGMDYGRVRSPTKRTMKAI